MAEALAAAGAAVVGRRAAATSAARSACKAIEKAGGKADLPVGRRDEPRLAGRGTRRGPEAVRQGDACSSTGPAATSRKEPSRPAATSARCRSKAGMPSSTSTSSAARFCPARSSARPMVAAGRGSIINIASMSSILPLSRVVAYSASKAAVLNLTQWLAREWATKGVRVNAISPGFFPAEQNRRMLLKDDGTYTERGQAIVGHTPMGRFGERRGTGRRGGLAGVAEGVGFRHRAEHRRRWRLLVGDDLAFRRAGSVSDRRKPTPIADALGSPMLPARLRLKGFHPMTGTLQSLLAGFDPDAAAGARTDDPEHLVHVARDRTRWNATPCSRAPGRWSAGASRWRSRGSSSPRTSPANRSWWCAATTACCGPSSTSAGTAAAPVLHRGMRHGDEAALPLPRLDLRPGRQASAARRSSTACRTSAARTTACRRSRVAEWGPFVWVHLDPPTRTAGGVPRVRCPHWVAGARRLRRTEVARPQELRPRVQLEGLRR